MMPSEKNCILAMTDNTRSGRCRDCVAWGLGFRVRIPGGLGDIAERLERRSRLGNCRQRVGDPSSAAQREAASGDRSDPANRGATQSNDSINTNSRRNQPARTGQAISPRPARAPGPIAARVAVECENRVCATLVNSVADRKT